MSHLHHLPHDSTASSSRPRKENRTTKNPPILPPVICSKDPNSHLSRQHHHDSQKNRQLDLERYNQHKPSSFTLSSVSGDSPKTPGFNKGFPATFLTSPGTPREPLHKFPSLCQKRLERDQLQYSLNVYQQPCHARMVGNGDKADRRPIDPPPVLRLEVSDKSQPSESSVHLTLLRSPYFICYSTLCQSDPPHEEIFVTPHSGKPYMVGNIVSSTSHVREDNPVVPAGHYFLFSDLGVRVEGCYRLKFSVFEIVDEEVLLCATAMSEKFEVFPPKRFPGMKRPTDISSALSRQGIRMRLRNKSTSEAIPTLSKQYQQAEVNVNPTHKRKSTSNSDKSGPQTKAIRKSKLPHLKSDLQLKSQLTIPFIPNVRMTAEKNKSCRLPSIHSLLNYIEDDSQSSHSRFLEDA